MARRPFPQTEYLIPEVIKELKGLLLEVQREEITALKRPPKSTCREQPLGTGDICYAAGSGTANVQDD